MLIDPVFRDVILEKNNFLWVDIKIAFLIHVRLMIIILKKSPSPIMQCLSLHFFWMWGCGTSPFYKYWRKLSHLKFVTSVLEHHLSFTILHPLVLACTWSMTSSLTISQPFINTWFITKPTSGWSNSILIY